MEFHKSYYISTSILIHKYWYSIKTVSLINSFFNTHYRFFKIILLNNVIKCVFLLTSFMNLINEILKIMNRSINRVDVNKRDDIISAVFSSRRIDRIEPNRLDAQTLNIVELVDNASQIADTIIVWVTKRLDIDLIDGIGLPPLEKRRFVEQSLEYAIRRERAVNTRPKEQKQP